MIIVIIIQIPVYKLFKYEEKSCFLNKFKAFRKIKVKKVIKLEVGKTNYRN